MKIYENKKKGIIIILNEDNKILIKKMKEDYIIKTNFNFKKITAELSGDKNTNIYIF